MARERRPAEARHATPEEVEKAVAALTDADAVRLEKYAQFRARSLRAHGLGWSAEDLLQEAITRTFEGDRKWKHGIRFVKHLVETMRSVGNHVPDELKGGRVVAPADDCGDDESVGTSAVLVSAAQEPELVAAARQQLALIDARFAGDEVVQLVVEALATGMKGPEIQAALGITQREFETAMTRLRRGLDREEEGWRP